MSLSSMCQDIIRWAEEKPVAVTLPELLDKWQDILRLRDWDLTVRYGRMIEIEGEGLGHCRYSGDRREAEILIRRPEDQPEAPKWSGDDDDELTLVHELLHVKLAPLGVPDAKDRDLEPIVEQLARAFVKLDRRGR